jgi:preprotein translocase subunit SecA
MDQLRQGIHLRAYGGTDPLREYQFEGFEMFKEMIESIQEEVAKYIMKARVESNLERQEVAQGQTLTTSGGGEASEKRPAKRKETVGRNDACPCGSGKKYKQCHGA